jgi:hypothetical protein
MIHDLASERRSATARYRSVDVGTEALAMRARLAIACTGIFALATSGASASPFDPTGLVRVARKPIARLNASQSGNWFGYNEGAAASGIGFFNSIGGNWTVPVARQHRAHQAEDSATWIGIGGGCVDAGCALTDPTGLIQTGTEQNVASGGHASYSAWWELVPLPAVTIPKMTVKPHDRIQAAITQISPIFMWRITLKDLTRHETFTTTALYPSSRATAEWIEETPLNIGTSGVGTAPLPKLSRTRFTNATVNGHRAGLTPADRIDLTQGSTVIGTASAPNAHGDGFAACTWTRRCRLR